jgi:uncharacterized protein with ACT and thioredoxin-like domain
MRTVMIVSLMILLVLGVSALALGAEKKAELHHLQGEVVSIDTTAMSLTVKETLKDGKTKEVAFTLDANTKVTIHGKAGQLQDLKPGDPVKVSYHKTGTEHHAVAVALVKTTTTKP